MKKIATVVAALALAAGIGLGAASASSGHTVTNAGVLCANCWPAVV